ncbi:MAG: hypothetical protein Q9209_001590 [Squamulea sp. 1 TL-2023]
MVQSDPTSTLENLARLAAKPGVQSTLVLSKVDGSIIKSTGLLADPTIPSSSDPSAVGNGPNQDIKSFSPSIPSNSNSREGYEGHEGLTDSAQHVAKMVFKFVAAAKEFAEGMEEGDDARLLRMRTRKHEIVIVPGQAYQRNTDSPLDRLERQMQSNLSTPFYEKNNDGMVLSSSTNGSKPQPRLDLAKPRTLLSSLHAPCAAKACQDAQVFEE